MSAAISNKPVIQLHDLAKTYQTGEVEVKAVRGITLDIDRGDFVAIMGASGSGKSTLMNMLGCLDQPTSGSYLLDDIPVWAARTWQNYGTRRSVSCSRASTSWPARPRWRMLSCRCSTATH
jgi:ABC-type lipoprotein export system ATPase subunit